MRFSDRIGVTSKNELLYVDTIPDDLANSIWNVIVDTYSIDESDWKRLARHMARDFIKIPQDEIPHQSWQCKNWVKDNFSNFDWHEVYNFIEFLVSNHQRITFVKGSYATDSRFHPVSRDNLIVYFNMMLERERSGYRFIGGILSPITNASEVAEVGQALALTDDKAELARRHIASAVQLMSKRPDPDYRNAIKEAISAVESICVMLGGEKGDTLRVALKQLEDRTSIHPSLREAFVKMYGYTSDEHGIRHAMLETPRVELSDAKYMVVVCSAFVNFVVQKAQSAGLIK